MARKKLTTQQIIAKSFEEALQERNIAYTNKSGRYRLALIGNPEVGIGTDGFSIQFISDISGGFHGSKCHQSLHYEATLAKPDSHPCERILQVIDTLKQVMDLASNRDTVREMSYATVPSSTGKAAVRKILKQHKVESKVAVSDGVYNVTDNDSHCIAYIGNIVKNGRGEMFVYEWNNDKPDTYTSLGEYLAAHVKKHFANHPTTV